MSRAVGAPIAQLLANAQLARNGNTELMKDVNTRSREIGEVNKILKEFATLRRGKVRGDGIVGENSNLNR